MKNLFDLIQIALSWPVIAPITCAILALLTMQAFKLVRRGAVDAGVIITKARSYVLKFSLWNGAKWLMLTFLLYLNADNISNGLQYIEQAYIAPIYFVTDTSSAAVTAYERELQRFTSPAEFNTIVSETARTAAKVGSTPLSFYEVYLSECGLNPYALNITEKGDTVAVGIIQFTRAGVYGLTLDGVAVTFRQTVDAVRRHDIAYLMRLTDAYMTRACGGKPLPRSCDVYTAIYMPAFVGCKDETALASKWGSKPQYYWQNIGLDGWEVVNGKIMHLPKYRDGQITISDLALCLAAKKSNLLARYY